MIVSDALSDWTGDPARQAETQAAIDSFRHDWNHGPSHKRFDAAMTALPERTAEAVAIAVVGLFADDAWLESLISGLVEAMRRDPFFDPPFRNLNSDLHGGLLVYEDPSVAIGVGVTGAAQLAAKRLGASGPASISFAGQLHVCKFIRAGGARLSFWEAPRIEADFTAARAGRCVRTGEREIEDGEILIVDGRFQSYVIEQLGSGLILLQAQVMADQAPLAIEYDLATGAFVGASATGDTSSRIQMVSTLLRKLGRKDAFAAIAALLDHPDFFVRWHLMKELLGLDAAAALPHLKRMAARDPHPDPRRAARLVLDRLEAHSDERKAA